jgi:Pyridoxal-dependent decarboxylase, pyridoxal binding domain
MHKRSIPAPTLGAAEPHGPTDSIEAFFAENPSLQTPYLVVDLDVIRDRYRRLRRALPRAEIYYAVKANPDAAVLRDLSELGSHFDVAYSRHRKASGHVPPFRHTNRPRGSPAESNVMDNMLSLLTNSPLGIAIGPDPARFTPTFPLPAAGDSWVSPR